MQRFRIMALVMATALLGGVLGTIPAQAGHDDDIHSDNIKLLARKQIKAGDVAAQGSDLAFHGSRIYAGSYQGTALFKKVNRKKGYIKQIGFHNCPSSQGDISFVGRFVLVSID